MTDRSHGIDPGRLADDDLRRELAHLHETRHASFLAAANAAGSITRTISARTDATTSGAAHERNARPSTASSTRTIAGTTAPRSTTAAARVSIRVAVSRSTLELT